MDALWERSHAVSIPPPPTVSASRSAALGLVFAAGLALLGLAPCAAADFENRREIQDVVEQMTAFVPMGRACVMLRKTVRNAGTAPRSVRFGMGYEIPDDAYVVGSWSNETAGARTFAARWIGHPPC